MVDNYACIIDGAVVNVIVSDAAFAAWLESVQYMGWQRLVVLTPGAGIGWTWTEEGGFVPPEVPEE